MPVAANDTVEIAYAALEYGNGFEDADLAGYGPANQGKG